MSYYTKRLNLIKIQKQYSGRNNYENIFGLGCFGCLTKMNVSHKKSIQIDSIYIIKHLSFIFIVILAVAHKYVEMAKTVLQAEHSRMENV